MIIRSPEPEVKILVDRDPVKTSFEEWARPGHFSRTIAKGPDTTKILTSGSGERIIIESSSFRTTHTKKPANSHSNN